MCQGWNAQGKEVDMGLEGAQLKKSLMMASPPGLLKETIQPCVSAEQGEHHTNHGLLLSWHTPPIPVLEVSISPDREGGKGAISWSWVGHISRLAKIWPHACSLSCTADVRCTCLPLAAVRAC